MAEYIEREALLSELQEEIDFETSMYTEEQNKYFNMGLKCAVRDVKSQPTADVVPKSEVVKVLDEIEKTIRGALVLVGFSYKHNPKEIQCKKECYEDFLGYIAELKKKYTREKE